MENKNKLLEEIIKQEFKKIFLNESVNDAKYEIGDLVWCPDAGQEGLTGMIVSDAKRDEEDEIDPYSVTYDVYLRGYNGDIIPMSPKEFVDLLDPAARLDKADERTDVDTYTNIGKKRGIVVNPKYAEALENSEEGNIDEIMGVGFAVERRADRNSDFEKNGERHAQNENELDEVMGVGFAVNQRSNRRHKFEKRGERHAQNENTSLKESLLKEKEALLKQLNEHENVIAGRDINEILKHYVAAALWSSTNPDNEREEFLDQNYSFEDIDHDTLISMYNDIKKFVEENRDAIEATGMTDEQLGHDLWLTRNRHGAGFFARGYDKEIEKRLTAAAQALGETNLFVGDDGKNTLKIHGEGGMNEMMGVGFGPEHSIKRRQNYIGKHHNPQAPQSQAALMESLKKEKTALLKTLNEESEMKNESGRKSFTKYPYQMLFSDRGPNNDLAGIANAVGGNSVKKLVDEAKKRNLKSFAIYKSNVNGKNFHNASDDDFLVCFYDETGHDFWSNVAVKHPEINDKKLESLNSEVTGNLEEKNGGGTSFSNQRVAGQREFYANNKGFHSPQSKHALRESLLSEKTELLKTLSEGNKSTSTEPEGKDVERINDIIKKAGGKENETALAKARQMANSITDCAKAKRRAKAAKDLGYMQIAGIFSIKAKELEA